MKPKFSYVLLADGKMCQVTCDCGWKDGQPMLVGPFDPAEALVAAHVEHPRCVANGQVEGGPTLAGEDISSDPLTRMNQIRQVMGLDQIGSTQLNTAQLETLANDLVDELQRQQAECNQLRTRIAEFSSKYETRLQAMRACIVYARDRRGGLFDFDVWSEMVKHALDVGERSSYVPPHALEEAQSEVTRLSTALNDARAELAAWKKTASALQHDSDVRWRRSEIDKLNEKLRVAEVVRDDARAASARDVEERRTNAATLDELNRARRRIDELGDALTRLRAENEENKQAREINARALHAANSKLGIALNDASIANQRAEQAWKKGVLEANDKLYAAKISGIELSWDKVFELLNILLDHPPEADDDTYEGSFREAADNEGRSAAKDRRVYQITTGQTAHFHIGEAGQLVLDDNKPAVIDDNPADGAQRFYEANRRFVTIGLTLEEATIIACAVAHHRDSGFSRAMCQEILRKIEEACR